MSVRVLYFDHRLARAGGIPRFTRGLLSTLDKERFEVHACTIRPLYEQDRLQEIGSRVELHTLGMEGPISAAKRLGILAGLRRLVARLRPRVLHLQDGTAWYSIPGALTSPRSMVKIIQTHDPPESGRCSRWNYRLQRWMIRALGYTPVADSTAVRDGLVHSFGLAPHRIPVAHLGIEVGMFDPSRTDSRTWRQRNGIPDGVPIVLYVARLVEYKNIPLFLEVARRVLAREDAFFLVAGGGPLQAELERSLAAAQSERIRLLGFREDLDETVLACDLFLSTSDWEGFGLAIVEASAAGKPVIATAVGGVNDLIVEGVTGHLCPAGDAESLATACLRLLRDAAARQSMGTAARQRAHECFSLEAMAGRYENLYDLLVAGDTHTTAGSTATGTGPTSR